MAHKNTLWPEDTYPQVTGMWARARWYGDSQVPAADGFPIY